MIRRNRFPLALAALLAFSLPAVVHAEEETAEQTAPKKKKVRKAKAKPKAAAPVVPAGPVPYTSLTPSTAPHAQSVTPGPPAHAMTPDALPQPVETSKPLPPASDVAIADKAGLPAPSPPPPTATLPPVAPTVGTPAQISLKCETQVTVGKRVVSTGSFYIDLFPSAVFPDQSADFKFTFVDPAHKSLIRGSVCLDITCSASVTQSAYYLVNRTTKKGAALRITLDRSRGAFYAEAIDEGLFGMFGGDKDGDHPGESGYCTPQPLPAKLF